MMHSKKLIAKTIIAITAKLLSRACRKAKAEIAAATASKNSQTRKLVDHKKLGNWKEFGFAR